MLPSSKIFMTPLWWDLGATGGVAAKTLAQQGLSVLVLDAGPQLSPQVVSTSSFTQGLFRLLNLATRKQSYQALHPGYWKVNPNLFVNEQENPYSTPKDRPFYWIRGRQVGGRSLTGGALPCGFRTTSSKLPATMVMVKTGPSAMENWTRFMPSWSGRFRSRAIAMASPNCRIGNYKRIPRTHPGRGVFTGTGWAAFSRPTVDCLTGFFAASANPRSTLAPILKPGVFPAGCSGYR